MESERNIYIKKETNFKNIFYIALSSSIITIAFAFFYYNVIHKPQLEKNKIELQKIELENKLKLQKIQKDNEFELKRIEQEKKLELQKIEKEKSFEIKTNIAEIEKEYLQCKEDAYTLYTREWSAECKRIGRVENIATPLPINIADRLNEQHKERLELCENEYKIKLDTLKLK